MPSQALEELVSPHTDDRHCSLHYSPPIDSASSQEPLMNLSLHSLSCQQAQDGHRMQWLRIACMYGQAQCKNKRGLLRPEKKTTKNAS